MASKENHRKISAPISLLDYPYPKKRQDSLQLSLFK